MCRLLESCGRGESVDQRSDAESNADRYGECGVRCLFSKKLIAFRRFQRPLRCPRRFGDFRFRQPDSVGRIRARRKCPSNRLPGANSPAGSYGHPRHRRSSRPSGLHHRRPAGDVARRLRPCQFANEQERLVGGSRVCRLGQFVCRWRCRRRWFVQSSQFLGRRQLSFRRRRFDPQSKGFFNSKTSGLPSAPIIGSRTISSQVSRSPMPAPMRISTVPPGARTAMPIPVPFMGRSM